MAGPLFRELAEDISKVWSPCLLYTGHPHTAKLQGGKTLLIRPAPAFNRKNNLMRFISWMRYFFKALALTAAQPNRPLLFIVSNPPFLGILGYFFRKMRNQEYVILVYDIYPDVLIGLHTIQKGIVSRMWDYMNRIIFENASLVYTISDDMAGVLDRKCNISQTKAGKALAIPTWVDIETIKPMRREDNWFAQKHTAAGTITVLYSGNMGNTHDIESLLEVCKRLKDSSAIQFLLIGEGTKWTLIQETIKEFNLRNATLLPFQPEEMLPFSLAAGDIGIVTYAPGTEEFIMPSKAYYYMAAGLAVAVVCSKETELSRMVTQARCGLHLRNSDPDGFAEALQALINAPGRLSEYKKNARHAAEHKFSRINTALYVDSIKKYINFSWNNDTF